MCDCASYCSSFALQVRASSDAEAQPSPLLFMQNHYMDIQQLLWRTTQWFITGSTQTHCYFTQMIINLWLTSFCMNSKYNANATSTNDNTINAICTNTNNKCTELFSYQACSSKCFTEKNKNNTMKRQQINIKNINETTFS